MVTLATSPDNLIEVTDLTKRYKGFSLESIDFTLAPGYVLGLIGPNGAGKTTLIKLLLGAVRPDSGSIKLLGIDTMERGWEARADIGFVHEVPPIYSHMTVDDFALSVALFYRDWNHDLFHETAKRFDLPLGRKTGKLSRGMRMKLALAMALSHDARLLILDEPTSGLDPVFRREFLQELREYIEDGERSILFSTHITTDLEHIADYIVYLRGGQIRLAESVEAIRDNWKLVRGGVDALTDEIRSFCKSVVEDTYSFTAITARPERVTAVANGAVELEPATFEDLVVLLEVEHE